MTSHWGEFETPEAQNEEVIPADVVKYFIMKAMQHDPFRILPMTSSSAEPVSDLDLISSETLGLEIDDRVVHTIKLLQHSKQMTQLIEAAKEQTDLMADSQINTFPPALEIPDHPIGSFTYKINYPLQYMDKEYSDFNVGKGPFLPEVTMKTAKQLLKKSVAALVAHSGFDLAKESILNTFTDVIEEYIQKIAMLMRVAADQGANVAATGFPDAIERVFHEMNIGSVRCLHGYYQNNIIKYHEKIWEECKALNLEYSNIAIPIKSENLSLDTIAKLEEPDDVPEIHFPALGDGDGVDELQPSLEPGFQMLHSLEQEAHLQTLEPQEDESVHVNDSPTQEIPGDALHSHLLIKRRKRM